MSRVKVAGAKSVLRREEAPNKQDGRRKAGDETVKTIDVHTTSSDTGVTFNGRFADYARLISPPLPELRSGAISESVAKGEETKERKTIEGERLHRDCVNARPDNPTARHTLKELKQGKVISEEEAKVRRQEIASYEELGATLDSVKKYVADPRFNKLKLEDFKVQRVDLGDEIAVVLRGKIHSKGPQMNFIPREYNIGDAAALPGTVAVTNVHRNPESGKLSKQVIMPGIEQVHKQWNHAWLKEHDPSTETKAKKWAAIYHHEETHALGAVHGQRYASEYGAYKSQQSYEVRIGLRGEDQQRSDEAIVRFALRSSVAPGSDIWLFLDKNNGRLGEDGREHIARRGYSEDEVKEAVASWLVLQREKMPSPKEVEAAYRKVIKPESTR